jgi:Tol biopolymer transport system component
MKTNRPLAVQMIALALFSLLAAGTARAQCQLSPSVAFHSHRDGNNNIYVMNADGSCQTPLTTDPGDDRRADISPDGSRIAFASNRTGHFEIFVMNSDGSDVQQVTFTPATVMDPTTMKPISVMNTWSRWSPDGEWIAFQSNVSLTFQIHVIRPDGSEQRQITNSAVNQFPAWSPDGTRLAVRRDVGTAMDIYVIDVAGQSDPVPLTTLGPLNQMASWSPDGTKIAFMSTREHENNTQQANYPSVFVMNADGSDQLDLTPKEDSATGTWSSRAPAWSPNGKYIYFTGMRPLPDNPQQGSPEQIYLMRADGSHQLALTDDDVNAEATVRQAAQLRIPPLGYEIVRILPVPGDSRAIDVKSRVWVTNTGAGAIDARAHIASTSPTFIVLDGEVQFGDVPRTPFLQPALSIDTFSLRIRLPARVSPLTWLELARAIQKDLVWQISCANCAR